MIRRSVLFGVLLICLAALYHQTKTQAQLCRLTLTLVDAESKETIPGVVRCFAQSGGPAIPLAGSLSRGQGLKGNDAIQDWYVISQAEEILLPRQQLRLEALAGLETELATALIDLTGQDRISLTIPIRTFSRISKDGWYAGNTHLHLSNLNQDQADRYLKEIPRADRLEVLFISYLERALVDKDYITNRYPIGDLTEFWSTGVLVNNGEEHRHNFGDQGEGFGHVMLLNIKRLIQPVSIGQGISRSGTDGTTLQMGIDDAHRQGGVAIWCHNSWGLEDVPNFVSGKLDAQNIFDGGAHGSYEDGFYHYLNAGIRVPFSTGTDWFIYDLARVYVGVRGSLGIKPWLDALVAGRSFITNGPILKLTVQGREIGATVELKQPQEVLVQAEGTGRSNFEKLELVKNGRVIAQANTQPHEGTFQAQLQQRVRIQEPAWLALRISTQATNEYGRPLFGHTSPVYITVEGRSIRMDQEVAYLREQIRQARRAIAAQAVFATKEERERVLSVYERAVALLEQRS
ncbi:MAG: CehA/McbA family metallohydrolase [Acidobacteriota bacterium]